MKDDSRLNVSLIVPAYNEALRVESVIVEALKYVQEVIVVDDGSGDKTAEIATQSGAIVISLPQNRGYVNAIKTGFSASQKPIVVTMDGDGEFDPSCIVRLVEPIASGRAEMVQGRRLVVPRLSEGLINFVANVVAPIGDSGTGFRAIDTRLAQKLKLKGRCICGVLALEVAFLGGRIEEVDIELRGTNKVRNWMPLHLLQLIYIFPWFFKKSKKQYK